MQQLEQLRDQIRLLQDLQAVVRTMKAMARVAVRRHEQVRDALQQYAANVELAVQAFLQDQRFRESGGLPAFLTAAPAAPERVGVILFGSDHGLCGAFNERVLARHDGLLEQRGLDAGAVRRVVAGVRLSTLLEARNAPCERSWRLPHAEEGTTRLIQELMEHLETWRFRPDPLDQILLIHHRVSGVARSEVVVQQLLPLRRSWLLELWERPWDSASRPLLYGDAGELFRVILREVITVSLHRAVIESLASENAARLAAMHAAEGNLDERLGELNHTYRRERQNAITAELLDVVGGFEALQREG